MSTGWSAVVSVHRDDEVLQRNLLRSPALAHAREVLCQRGYDSVASAYNMAIREAATDVVVFLHPDVYLPDGWHESLQQVLRWLKEHDPNWGVLGLFGSSADGAGRGFTFSTGLGQFVGTPFSTPTPVRTVDEFVFAVRRGSGLTFDEALPGAQSQLCATDLCLQAETKGLGVYVVPCFALHNSNGWSYLPIGFWRPYLYIRKKWRSALPVRVPYARITRGCLPMIRNSLRALRRGGGAGHRTNSRHADVVKLHDQLRSDMAAAFSLVPGPVAPSGKGSPSHRPTLEAAEA